ncbi:hypothetical protein BVRB_9g225920 [Beta vulgaris subsp. vulgaris]|uniref:Uncharacterized protein n=1 Tax=Beta vulgaris subsp. vulgaris TaxID=3555 RepID=A0A0J8DZR2_BETVV|nr:hypothetical protein BVRB_9g225920 [Beta vulgaris subsp. vulgaris]
MCDRFGLPTSLTFILRSLNIRFLAEKERMGWGRGGVTVEATYEGTIFILKYIS